MAASCNLEFLNCQCFLDNVISDSLGYNANLIIQDGGQPPSYILKLLIHYVANRITKFELLSSEFDFAIVYAIYCTYQNPI